MDTTYRGRKFGYMVWKDYKTGKNLLFHKVPYETKKYYLAWTKELQENWIKIIGIVCDWKRGLLWSFWEIPTQMCHFHQKQIITRYLTRNPRISANKELRDIGMSLWRWKRKTRELWLNSWYLRNKERLYEKNEFGWFIHRRTKSAYRSLKRNIEFLFAYEKYDLLPKTTNKLEWEFSWLKQRLGNHRGLNQKRKEKFIEWFLNK